MTTTNVRIPQLNIMRSRADMETLINDPETQDLDVFLIHEPPVTAYRTHVNHALRQLYQPTHREEGTRKRSLLYVNKRISTSAHRQIRCNSPDVAAEFLFGGLAAFCVFERWRAILKARDGRHLIRTGFPRSAISFKYFSRAISSGGVRYC
jgi:hypothetical protein